MITETGQDVSVEASEGYYAFGLRDVPRIVWRWWWLLAITVIVIVGATVGISLQLTPTYEASIKILVGQESGLTEAPGDVMGLQQLTQTLAEVVESRPVAEGVIQQLNLRVTPEDFLKNMSAQQIRATQVIQVDYEASSPEEAQQVANAIGDVFSSQVSDASSSANSITVTVWERAALPTHPVIPNMALNVGLALVLGGVLGIGLVFLLEHLDDSWRSPEEAEQISGAPNFGVIPKFERSKRGRKVPKQKAKRARMFRRSRKAKPSRGQEEDEAKDLSGDLITTFEPSSAAAEAYRTLRTNLLYAFVDNHPQVIVLTSPGSREGKSTTCANLGVVLAQAAKSVLLMDCDLRRPALHKIFKLRNTYGIVDILARERSLQEAWYEPLPSLKIVTTGPVPPNPAELLGTRRFAEFIDQTRQEFDYVLMDVGPVVPVTDAAVLAAQGDGVLLILDAENTRKGSLRRSVQILNRVGANILGTVMDNVETSSGDYYSR